MSIYILPTVVSSILSSRRAIATMTRTSFLDSLVSWKYAPILVRDIYSAAFPMIVFIWIIWCLKIFTCCCWKHTHKDVFSSYGFRIVIAALDLPIIKKVSVFMIFFANLTTLWISISQRRLPFNNYIEWFSCLLRCISSNCKQSMLQE